MEKLNKYDLSIVIPVYNGASVVSRCLDSIYAVDWGSRSFETIVVDDCSTDNTMEVLKEQSLIHENLSVIGLKVNSKPGAARNLGIKQISGQYLLFVDSDDTVESGITRALDYALKAHPDILACRIKEQLGYNDEFIVKEYPLPEHKRFSGREFSDTYYDSSIHGHFSHFLFRVNYLKEQEREFAEGVVYEDLDWVEHHLYNCSSIEYDPAIIYSYYYTPSSILHKDGGPKDVDTLLFCYRRLQFAYSVRDKSPQFFNKIYPITNWVYQMLSFKRLTRYSKADLVQLAAKLDPEAIPFFQSLNWHGFTKLFINHPKVAIALLSVVHPFLHTSRSIYHWIKTSMKNNG